MKSGFEYCDIDNQIFKFRFPCSMSNVLDPNRKLRNIYLIHSKPEKMLKSNELEKKKKKIENKRGHLKRNAQKKSNLFQGSDENSDEGGKNSLAGQEKVLLRAVSKIDESTSVVAENPKINRASNSAAAEQQVSNLVSSKKRDLSRQVNSNDGNDSEEPGEIKDTIIPPENLDELEALLTEKITKKRTSKEFDKFEKYDSNKAKKKHILEKNEETTTPEKADSAKKPASDSSKLILEEKIQTEGIQLDEKDEILINQNQIKTQPNNQVMEIADSSQCESNSKKPDPPAAATTTAVKQNPAKVASIKPEEDIKNTEEKKRESEDWGYKYYTMKDDDAIYEMNYQDGTKKNSVKLLKTDFDRLEPSVYLNDTLILFFLKFLQNFVLTIEQNQRVHIFNSYFMELITNKVNAGGLLMQYNQTTQSGAAQKYDIQFNKMKRWTRSIDLFNGNIQHVFVPICENEHWSLAIICQPDKAGKLIDDHIKWCESGKPTNDTQQGNQSPNDNTQKGHEKDNDKENQDKEKPIGKPNTATGATSASSFKYKNDADKECAKVLNLTSVTDENEFLNNGDINDLFHPENPEEMDMKKMLHVNTIRDGTPKRSMPSKKKVQQTVQLQLKQPNPPLLQIAEPLVENLMPTIQDQLQQNSGLVSIRDRLAAKHEGSFLNTNHNLSSAQSKTQNQAQMRDDSCEIENQDKIFFSDLKYEESNIKKRQLLQNLEIPKATGPIKQYDIKTFLASQGEGSDEEDFDQFDDSPLNKMPTKLLLKENQKLLKNKIIQKHNEKKINQFTNSVNVGVKRTKLDENIIDNYEAQLQSLNEQVAEFAGNGSKLQRITLNSSKQTKGNSKKSNSNSKTKKQLQKQQKLEDGEIQDDRSMLNSFNINSCIAEESLNSRIMTASKNHPPSNGTLAPQENGNCPPHFEKVSENITSNHDNSILGELNNSLKQPLKHNLPASEKEKKKLQLREKMKARKLFMKKPLSTPPKITSLAEDKHLKNITNGINGEIDSSKVKRVYNKRSPSEPRDVSDPNSDSRPKNKVGRPKKVDEGPNLSIKKKDAQDPNSIYSPTKEGGGGTRNLQNFLSASLYRRAGGGGKDPQNLHERLNDSSIIEETGANNPPPMNPYRSNLGGGGYDQQFDSDDDDDFSDQNQVQKFNSDHEYDRSYVTKGGNVKDDEVMVDDEGLMHKAPGAPNGMSNYGIYGTKHHQKKSSMKQHGKPQQPFYDHMPDNIEDSDSEMQNYRRMHNGGQMGNDSDDLSSVDSRSGMMPGQNLKNMNSKEYRMNQMMAAQNQRYGDRNGRDPSDSEDYDQEGEDQSEDYDDEDDMNPEDEFNNYLKRQKKNRQQMEDMEEYEAPQYNVKPKPKLPEMPKEAEMEKPFILYMDSLNRVNSTNMQCLRQYIEMEYIDKKLKNDPGQIKWLTEEHGWKGLKHEAMPHYQPSVPIQKNYTDCGLYLLENAEAFIRDPTFILGNLYQKEVKLFKTRLVEDKRDIIKRIITALAELKVEKTDNQFFVGENYRQWRESLFQKMTHFSTKLEPDSKEKGSSDSQSQKAGVGDKSQEEESKQEK